MSVCHNHHHCQEDALHLAEKICQKAGARFTQSRRDVFIALWGGHKALTAAEVMAKIGNNQPPITYRSLAFLKQYGLVHHIASLNAYVGCLHAQDEAHMGQMLVCTNCKTVLEVNPEEEGAILLKQAQANGFKVQHTHIEMLGLCKNCADGA